MRKKVTIRYTTQRCFSNPCCELVDSEGRVYMVLYLGYTFRIARVWEVVRWDKNPNILACRRYINREKPFFVPLISGHTVLWATTAEEERQRLFIKCD